MHPIFKGATISDWSIDEILKCNHVIMMLFRRNTSQIYETPFCFFLSQNMSSSNKCMNLAPFWSRKHLNLPTWQGKCIITLGLMS